MIAESKKIGVKEVCGGKDLVKGNAKVNTLFVAEVFNTRHGLEISEEEAQLIEKFGNDYDDVEGSREERAFRLWINSLGIEDVFINNLYDDARDGLVLLKVCHKIKPESVDWNKVVVTEKVDGKGIKKMKLGPFDVQSNCDRAYEAAENVIGKKQVGIAGKDIYDANKKLILALVWQLCRVHYL